MLIPLDGHHDDYSDESAFDTDYGSEQFPTFNETESMGNKGSYWSYHYGEDYHGGQGQHRDRSTSLYNDYGESYHNDQKEDSTSVY
ncbi:hypothetical protein PoB_005574700 [Plakobranchus ocellatus]|uniref:Uncharacterized protein n=1 Tax=Plakobranchus ocellatus TaxID=259542 RepID=A0AAV4CD38_9GAST|nr:hypothetical protein PoB_005574700 [Plakobranchus ocellatus]